MDAQIGGLVASLRQLREVVESLEEPRYARRGIGGFDGSIGGHVRHCLDHVEALLAGVECGRVDYDRRQRGTEVETNRAEASRLLRDVERRLGGLADRGGGEPMRVTVLTRPDGAPVETLSTLAREVASVHSHTIHHCAIIAMLARSAGAAVPEHFGYAPATIAHLQKTA